MKLYSMFFITLIILFVLPNCNRRLQTANYEHIQFTPTVHLKLFGPKAEHHIIVFIHGTILPLSSFTCFSQYQPKGPDGLCLVSTKSSLLAQIAADYFANFYQEFYPNIQLSCYTFGWSGCLSQSKRLQASDELYQQLIKEIKTIRSPKITLFGHSHGGNVILNLAHAEEKYRKNLVIDKTILLGTPIQSETRVLLENTLFTNIYNCYSHGDKVQKIDFISTKDDYSQRRFTIEQNKSYSKKLTQIELQLGAQKPGHGELWLQWGKKNFVYRKNLPIFPLPMFMFLPEIIHKLDKLNPSQHDVMVSIDQKDSNYTIAVYNNNTKNIGKKLVEAKLNKESFAHYVQIILQNEHVLGQQVA